MCKMREITHTVSRILHVFAPALPHFTQTLGEQTRTRLMYVIQLRRNTVVYPIIQQFATYRRQFRLNHPSTSHTFGQRSDRFPQILHTTTVKQ